MPKVATAKVEMAFCKFYGYPIARCVNHVPLDFLVMIGCTNKQIIKYRQSGRWMKCSQFTYKLVDIMVSTDKQYLNTMIAACRAKYDKKVSVAIKETDVRTRGRV